MARPVKRAYDTRRRQAQARETQAHIAEAARELFVERGWVATSIRDVAERAGVSVQTIYNAFEGGKAAIALPSGENRTFLQDGDEILMTAWAEKEGYRRIGFGECRARISG